MATIFTLSTGETLLLERKQNVQQPQPEVGAHVGPLPD